MEDNQIAEIFRNEICLPSLPKKGEELRFMSCNGTVISLKVIMGIDRVVDNITEVVAYSVHCFCRDTEVSIKNILNCGFVSVA